MKLALVAGYAQTDIGVALKVRNPLPAEAGAELSARCSASSCTGMYTPAPALRASPMSARSLRFLSLCIENGLGGLRLRDFFVVSVIHRYLGQHDMTSTHKIQDRLILGVIVGLLCLVR